MKKILLFLSLLLLFSCRSKKVKISQEEQRQNTEIATEKDSVLQSENTQKASVFQLENIQSFQVELQSETDHEGNSKELIFEHLKQPNGELIKVKNGKITLKKQATHTQTQKDTLFTEEKRAQIIEKETISVQKEKIEKTKEKQVQGVPFGYVCLFLLVLIVGVAIKIYRKKWK